MKKQIFTPILLLILISNFAIAGIGTVLDLIPNDVSGFLYFGALLQLNDKINDVYTDAMQMDPEGDFIAEMLADMFDAGFQSLDELEEIGLDLGKDFAIFYVDQENPNLSAVAHVIDSSAILAQIRAKSEEGGPEHASTDHRGETYYSAPDGEAYAIIDDVLVFSDGSSAIEKVIDTFKDQRSAISKNRDFTSLKIDTDPDRNDAIAYLAVEKLVDANEELISDAVDQLIYEADSEDAPIAIDELADLGLDLISQMKNLSITVRLDDGDLIVSPFFKFKPESEMQDHIQPTRNEMSLLKFLPARSVVNIASQISGESVKDFGLRFMKMMLPSDLEAEWIDKYKDTIAGFYNLIGTSEYAASIDFSTSFIPDSCVIYNLQNEKRVKAEIDQHISALIALNAPLLNSFGNFSDLETSIEVGGSEIYEGVEIKNSQMFDLQSLVGEDLSPELSEMMGDEINIFYAIHDKKLIYATGSDSKVVRDAIDRIDGTELGFNDSEDYDDITEILSLNGTVLCAISPITAINRLTTLFAQSDPNIGMIQMLLSSIPETYSIGLGSENRDGGVVVKLFVDLTDLGQIVAMFAAMQGM